MSVSQAILNEVCGRLQTCADQDEVNDLNDLLEKLENSDNWIYFELHNCLLKCVFEQGISADVALLVINNTEFSPNKLGFCNRTHLHHYMFYKYWEIDTNLNVFLHLLVLQTLYTEVTHSGPISINSEGCEYAPKMGVLRDYAKIQGFPLTITESNSVKELTDDRIIKIVCGQHRAISKQLYSSPSSSSNSPPLSDNE